MNHYEEGWLGGRAKLTVRGNLPTTMHVHYMNHFTFHLITAVLIYGIIADQSNR